MSFWIARVPGLLALPKSDQRIADGQPRLLSDAVFATIDFKPTFAKFGGFGLSPDHRRRSNRIAAGAAGVGTRPFLLPGRWRASWQVEISESERALARVRRLG